MEEAIRFALSVGASDAFDATAATADPPALAGALDVSIEARSPDVPSISAAQRAVLDRLTSMSPDELTPRAALELLYEWRARLADD